MLRFLWEPTRVEAVVPQAAAAEENRHLLRTCKSGFTLIELIMTIVVVAILAIPLSLLVSQHMQSTYQSRDLTLVLNLARFEMEKINNMPYANIMNYSNSTYEGYNYSLNRTINYVYGNNASQESLKNITITVTKPSSKLSARLVTYRAKNLSFGQ